MRFHRHRRRVLWLVAVIVLAACGSPGSDEPPTTPNPSLVEAPSDVSGWLDQVDRAREVSDQLEERNADLENQLPSDRPRP